jgi:hypothetical protein
VAIRPGGGRDLHRFRERPVPRLGAQRPEVGAEFVDEMRDALELCPTRLAKFELGLSAGINPSGASNLELQQRTERSYEKAGA